MFYQPMQADVAAERPGKNSIVRAQAYTLPYDAGSCRHDRYQAYYLEGIRESVGKAGAGFERRPLARLPRTLGYLKIVRHSWRLRHVMDAGNQWAGRTLDRLGGSLCTLQKTPSGLFHPSVGQYVFHLSDGTVRYVCIDSHDSGELASPELAQWSDLYFKTNYWPDHVYPANIRPCFNCNPLLLGKFEELRALRSVECIYDLCFIVRVWGGTDEVGGVEHILRLLEAVAQVDCKKYLLAYLVAGDIDNYARRLARSGISSCRKPLRIRDLWKLTASSRLNVIRLGMHACIPWRMMDLLAMGACPVLDQPPFTLWPVRLQEGTHYLHLNAIADLRHPIAAEAQYEGIPAMLSGLLSQRPLIDKIRSATADYFDRCVTPLAVGDYICWNVTALGERPAL